MKSWQQPTTHHVSRRAMLRGLGVTMALPWLESFPVWGDEPVKAGASSRPCAWPCCSPATAFTARSGGPRAKAGPWSWARCSNRCEPFKEKLLFIRGLYNAEAGKGGIHSARPATCSPARRWKAAAASARASAWIRLLAQRLGDQTKVPSLVLGCEPSIAALHKGYSMIYSSHISWSSPTTPTPLELYPALAFDRLFRDEVGQGDASVLDLVLEEARSLGNRVSHADRRKLDEYLSSRSAKSNSGSQQAGKEGRLQGWRPTLDKPNMPRPADGVPQDIDQHMRLMCDILVLAFQTDTTPICTLKLNNDHSSHAVPEPEGRLHDPSPAVAHRRRRLAARSTSSSPQQVAYIAGKLDQIQEGERTALDNTMLMFLSSMLHGNHDCTQLPVVMLGKGGGQLQTGRVLDYLGKPNRKMCSLYLALMDKMGVKLDRFGDSTERLLEI